MAFLSFIFLQGDCIVKKIALKSDWMFCFTVPFSLAEEQFRAKDSAIRE